MHIKEHPMLRIFRALLYGVPHNHIVVGDIKPQQLLLLVTRKPVIHGTEFQNNVPPLCCLTEGLYGELFRKCMITSLNVNYVLICTYHTLCRSASSSILDSLGCVLAQMVCSTPARGSLCSKLSAPTPGKTT